MAKRRILLDLGVRVAVALTMLAIVFAVDTTWVSHGWAQVLAATSQQIYLMRNRHEHSTAAIVYYDGPLPGGDAGRTARIATGIGPQCTYLPIAAMMAPFLVRRLSWRDTLRGCTATVVAVFFVNYVRLRFYFDVLRDYSRFWRHDLPHYVCVTGCIVGAIWWWHKRLLTKPGPTMARGAE